MDQRTKAIAIGAVALLLVAAALIATFYLLRVSRSTPLERSTNGALSQLPVVSTAPSPAASGNEETAAGSNKTYIGQGFSLDYPSSWGILTCGNSQNFELDPVSSIDAKNIACDEAVKPVTVLVVNKLSCTGETLNIGSNQAVKSKSTSDGASSYKWCVKVGDKNLDITHRVTSSGARATSKDDFSAQVEQVIKTLKVSPRAS